MYQVSFVQSAKASRGLLTCHVITSFILLDRMPALRIGTSFGGTQDQLLRRCFLFHSLFSLGIVVSTCLTSVPRHFVCEASLEVTYGACHDG